MTARETIIQGKAVLGIELGSTRIKAVLIDQENKPIAQGSHEWENQLVDGLWTYSTEAIWYGLEDAYADLRKYVKREYDCEIEILASIGISAMMHGYMAFGPTGTASHGAPASEAEKILVPFRTWRNTNTGKAAAQLSELFNYNIPLRWSISHLYEAILEVHFDRRNFSSKMLKLGILEETGDRPKNAGPRIPVQYRFNKERYAEMKSKGFKLEF